jgi:protein-S-isoprenylcysteine O-methyltransferase Ste14
MELPAPVVMFVMFIRGTAEKNAVLVIFLLLWELHYIHRTFIFPLRIRGDRRQMTVTVVLMAFGFNIINGVLNGTFLFSMGTYALQWLADPRFFVGLLIFLAGFATNQISDAMLRNLRSRNGDAVSSGKRYFIPEGFLFGKISCPNYFGEMVEWLGWAVLTWSLSGFAFFIWTAANLVPRALSHHRWYQQVFSEYPENRRAVIPHVL